jgi:thiamine-phosphate diphosphorylase
MAMCMLLFMCQAWNHELSFSMGQRHCSKTFASFAKSTNNHLSDHSDAMHVRCFRAMGDRPLLAVVTAPNACDTEESTKATWEALRQAVSTNLVDLISIRLNVPQSHKNDDNGNESTGNGGIKERAVWLTKKMVELADEKGVDPPLFHVVCSSDLVSVAVEARAHGVHVKEHHWPNVSDIVKQFDYPILIGTSAHSLQGIKDDSAIRPHYYFVGTCYMTASHPEKAASDLEGPTMPGKFKRSLTEPTVPVFAIGGIDEINCHEPMALGADGVAVIRAVVQADNPAWAVEQIQGKMKAGLGIR